MDEVLVQLVIGAKNVDTAVMDELEAVNYIVLTIGDTVCFYQVVTVLGKAPVVQSPGARPAPPLMPKPGRPVVGRSQPSASISNAPRL